MNGERDGGREGGGVILNVQYVCSLDMCVCMRACMCSVLVQ